MTLPLPTLQIPQHPIQITLQMEMRGRERMKRMRGSFMILRDLHLMKNLIIQWVERRGEREIQMNHMIEKGRGGKKGREVEKEEEREVGREAEKEREVEKERGVEREDVEVAREGKRGIRREKGMEEAEKEKEVGREEGGEVGKEKGKEEEKRVAVGKEGVRKRKKRR